MKVKKLTLNLTSGKSLYSAVPASQKTPVYTELPRTKSLKSYRSVREQIKRSTDSSMRPVASLSQAEFSLSSIKQELRRVRQHEQKQKTQENGKLLFEIAEATSQALLSVCSIKLKTPRSPIKPTVESGTTFTEFQVVDVPIQAAQPTKPQLSPRKRDMDEFMKTSQDRYGESISKLIQRPQDATPTKGPQPRQAISTRKNLSETTPNKLSSTLLNVRKGPPSPIKISRHLQPRRTDPPSTTKIRLFDKSWTQRTFDSAYPTPNRTPQRTPKPSRPSPTKKAPLNRQQVTDLVNRLNNRYTSIKKRV